MTSRRASAKKPEAVDAVRRALYVRFGNEAGRVATEVERAADGKDFSPQALHSAVVILRAIAASGIDASARSDEETTQERL